MEDKKPLQFQSNPTKENLDYARVICNEIMKQIRYPQLMVYFSWGAEKFQFGVGVNNFPILRFKVNGYKFKGYVHIIYNLMDYYEVEFVTTHNNLKHRIEEVYFDELQEKIDNYIERIDSYVF